MVVVWGCLANLTLAQHQNAGGVPLPGLPPQAPPHSSSLDIGGVPLPQPSNVPTGSGFSGSIAPGRELPPVIVPLDQGGVPLPPIPAGGGDRIHLVPLENDGGVTLPFPRGGAQGTVGVPLPPPYDAVGGGAGAQQPPAVGGGLAGARGGLRHVQDPEVDTTVQRVLGLAAVRDHLQLRTRADKAVKISDIVTAHKQVVSGQLVYLTVRVGETKCPIGTPDLSNCAFDHTEDSYICEIVVWERPWLNSSKVIDEKSRCAETEDDNDFNSWGSFSHFSHSPSEISLLTLPQGISEQQLVLEAFNYIDHGSESKFRGDMVNFNFGKIMFDPVDNMTKVEVNVEYGFKLCLKSVDQQTDSRVCPRDVQRDNYVCSVYVVHNPNQISTLEVIPVLEDDHEIHCERKRSVEEELVVPVRAPCLGCPKPAPLNDPTIMEIADFALKEYDRTADEDELHLILRLIKAQTQVVAGVKYYLTVELAETVCKKRLTGVDVNRTFCNQDLTEETKICDLHVVDQPWVPARDLVAAQCYDKDSYPTSSHDEFIVPVAVGTNFAAIPSTSSNLHPRTTVLGGQTPMEIDAEAMGLAQMVVAEYNRREDDPEYYKLVKVHEATSQVVSGKRYILVVEMAETNCHKFDPSIGNGEHCIINPREEHEVCRAEIYEPSPNNRRIVAISCEDLDDYFREHLMPTLNAFDIMDHPFLNLPQGTQERTGDGNAVPANDARVQGIAAFVVDQYNLRGDEDELYVLTNVVSAHTQVAAGMTKYLLEVEVAETHCKKYLPISDPTRCLIDHTEEREICQAEVAVPSDMTQAKHLIRLYCDDRNDYYTNKLRGTLFPGGTHQHLPSGSSFNGQWTQANVNDTSIKKLGHLIADEFDFRSDEDNLFIFSKIMKAQKQVASGLKYHLIVELLETVCPKYKRRIDKTRCVPDIGEDHMICEADVLLQPWLNKQEVMNLQCVEEDDFYEGDDSVEILYPKVHPSAHARPVFKSQFVIRTSVESEESNERFYHQNGRTFNRRHDSEEDDSDELPNFRGRRGLVGGYSEGDVTDPKFKEIADYAVKSMDSLGEDPRVRLVEEIQSVQTQVVAGVNYKLDITVYWTTCLKADEVEDLSKCERDTNEPTLSCHIVVYERPWQNYRKVTEATCNPVNGKQ